MLENCYIERELGERPGVEAREQKRLSYLLSSYQEPNNMSIYEEQDLLEFAKKNLERMEKNERR